MKSATLSPGLTPANSSISAGWRLASRSLSAAGRLASATAAVTCGPGAAIAALAQSARAAAAVSRIRVFIGIPPQAALAGRERSYPSGALSGANVGDARKRRSLRRLPELVDELIRLAADRGVEH